MFILQTIGACAIPTQTVAVVEKCPETEEEFRIAEKRKNCSDFDKLCSDHDGLVYHCVINPYVNETLEVCAYAQNIVGGKIN